MPDKLQRKALSLVCNLRDLALVVLALGCAQIVLSLIPWLLLFKSQPLGFSMALSLVGFGSWFIGFASSFGTRRALPSRETARGMSAPEQSTSEAAREAHPLVARLQERAGRSGCGFVLFLASLLPLALAFFLRLQADLQSGKTWSEIFPALP